MGVTPGGFEWEPDRYPALMRAEIPDYDQLQEALVAATRGRTWTRHPELGGADELQWLDGAGLRARVQWQRRDLAVIVAERP